MLRAVKLWKSSSMSGPSATRKPISRQYGDNFVQGLADGMEAAFAFRSRRQGDVDALGLQTLVQGSVIKCCAARLYGRRDRVLCLVDAGAEIAPLVGRQRTESFHQPADLAFLAQGVDPRLLQFRQARRQQTTAFSHLSLIGSTFCIANNSQKRKKAVTSCGPAIHLRSWSSSAHAKRPVAHGGRSLEAGADPRKPPGAVLPAMCHAQKACSGPISDPRG